jgi:hypothetical protein
MEASRERQSAAGCTARDLATILSRADEIHEQLDTWRRGPVGLERGEEIDAVAPVIGKAFDKPSGVQASTLCGLASQALNLG